MQQLWDLVPILVFVVAYFTTDIYFATGALMVAVTLQLVAYWLLKRPIGRELKFTFWASIIFGGLTLTLRNEQFIQWKPTVVNWAFSLALIGSHFVGKANLIQRLLGSQLEAPDRVWRTLNFGWAAGFFLTGLLNILVAYNFSLDFWVSYKLISGILLTLLYMLLTGIYLYRQGLLQEPAQNAAGESNNP
ncbi:MAG: inner membrane-spanning protein YciB [Pseudomonadota bacterium]